MIPACIECKYDNVFCTGCSKLITKGKTMFWQGTTKKRWHIECGDDSWRNAGTPYHIRQEAREQYRKCVINAKPLSDKEAFRIMITGELEQMKEKLTVRKDKWPFSQRGLQYMLQHQLIAETQVEWKDHYVITPKGFHWDMIKEEVMEL